MKTYACDDVGIDTDKGNDDGGKKEDSSMICLKQSRQFKMQTYLKCNFKINNCKVVSKNSTFEAPTIRTV